MSMSTLFQKTIEKIIDIQTVLPKTILERPHLLCVYFSATKIIFEKTKLDLQVTDLHHPLRSVCMPTRPSICGMLFENR